MLINRLSWTMLSSSSLWLIHGFIVIQASVWGIFGPSNFSKGHREPSARDPRYGGLLGRHPSIWQDWESTPRSPRAGSGPPGKSRPLTEQRQVRVYDWLAEKPAFGGLHCYGAPSTAALWRRSDDCVSMTQPYWHHNCTWRLLPKECARRARASLLSLCWASSWQCLRFAVAAEVPLRARECECLLLGIELPFYTCTHNNVPGISHSSSVNTQKTWRLFL